MCGVLRIFEPQKKVLKHRLRLSCKIQDLSRFVQDLSLSADRADCLSLLKPRLKPTGVSLLSLLKGSVTGWIGSSAMRGRRDRDEGAGWGTGGGTGGGGPGDRGVKAQHVFR